MFSCRFSEAPLLAEEEAPTRDNHPLFLKWNPSTPWCHALKHDPDESDGEPKAKSQGAQTRTETAATLTPDSTMKMKTRSMISIGSIFFYFRNVGFTQWKKKTQTEKIQLNLEKLNSTQLPISVRHGLDGPTSEEGREARPVSRKALHGTCVRGKRVLPRLG